MNADPTAAPDRSPSVSLDPTTRPPVILLERDASWDQVREDARALLESQSELWRGAEAHLDLGEREPELFDLRRLVHLLKDHFDINVVGLRCQDRALLRFAERELKVRIHLGSAEQAPPEAADGIDSEDTALPAEPSEEAPDEPTIDTGEITISEPVTGLTGDPLRVVHRTLRGGTVLRHGGDLVLYGDVNPGAEIIAGGSVTVLGSIKGLAHAGTRTGDRAWILGFDMKPTQLRIGQRIGIPSELGGGTPRGAHTPRLARVQDGAIVIEPYRGHLPHNEPRRSDA